MIVRPIIITRILAVPVLLAVLARGAVAESTPAFVGSAACASCHAKETSDWNGSHHQQAMAEATTQTVLGNFNDAKFSYNGIVSKFYRRGSDFFVFTDGPDGKLKEFKVDFTFGVYPLQQYLVKFPDGRMQALSISWDSRPVDEGGQRWFHLYENENVDHKDVLHWTKHSQNWNFMCAECHSTNLKKNYDANSKVFHTTWSEISVGCEACHGPGSAHVSWAARGKIDAAPDPGFPATMKSAAFVPRFDPHSGKTLSEPTRVRSKEMEACGRCHSRRSVVAEDYTYGQPLTQTHFPALLAADLYYADGQIRDEVYEYGSFAQSKMFHSGVSCQNCHNPHSLKLRQPGNAVCGQCHTAAKYDVPAHHFHKPGSPGAQCTSCHMPTRKYMVIDTRFDHSIRIPNPAQSARVGAPDACTSCHENKTSAWADEQIQSRFGAGGSHYNDYGEVFAHARAGSADSAQKLMALLADTKQPAIVRATAAREISPYLSPEVLPTLEKALADESSLVRAAALSALESVPPKLRVTLGAALLEDSVLSVRIEAARVLASLPVAEFTPQQAKALEKASAEYLAAQQMSAESPQAQVNIGSFYAGKGSIGEAESAYRTAIQLEPKFIPAYVNLSDLMRQSGRDSEGVQILTQAIKQVPTSHEPHYALGLLYVRLKDKQKALQELKKAVTLAPDNLQMSYVYIVALIDAGKKDEARKFLASAQSKFPNSNELAALGDSLK